MNAGVEPLDSSQKRLSGLVERFRLVSGQERSRDSGAGESVFRQRFVDSHHSLVSISNQHPNGQTRG